MAASFLKLSKGCLPYLKLIKLLYLADRKMLITRGRPISYDRWVSMNNGPVLSNTYHLIKGNDPASLWSEHIQTINRSVVLQSDPGTGDLSRAEGKIIADIFTQYGSLNWQELVRLTHELPEWQNPHGSTIEIPYQTVMRGAGFTEQEIEDTMDDIGADVALKRVLALV